MINRIGKMRQQINRKKIKIDPNMYIKEDASNQAFTFLGMTQNAILGVHTRKR